LGAGNGYFLPLLMRRCPGLPARVVVTDASQRLLELAEKHFRVPGAEYRRLDVGAPFPFGDGSFDLILATMVFNEVGTKALRNALIECYRVLRSGRLLATVAHPAFVEDLSRRGQLRRDGNGVLTMPGPRELRLPVHRRSMEAYATLLRRSGFDLVTENVFVSEKVRHERPGLRNVRGLPLALILACTFAASRTGSTGA
jgi:SAM-dependent methyltransferase